MLLINKNNRKHRSQLETQYKDLLEVNPLLNRKLVSFQANKSVPTYNWFKYKEGFSYQMVKMFIESFPKKKLNILDPFSGANTTLFVANELGLNSLGIELLPIGRFVLDSRLAANKVDTKKLKSSINCLRKLDFLKLPTDKQTNFKHVKITEKAFSVKTEQKLNACMKYIQDNIEDSNTKQLLRFACFCILERISYTRKDGQYLRWDHRANKSKTKFDKGKIFDFEEAFFDMADQIIIDSENPEFLFSAHHFTNAKIDYRQGSCLEIMPSLSANSFDLIISSPPYCNRYDYTRTYALELAFLGEEEETIKTLRQSMLSCTVENKDKQESLKALYKCKNQNLLFTKAEEAFKTNEALGEVLNLLEEHKDKKRLNNPGIYRMVKNYFYEHSLAIFQMARLLKKGGRVYYVNDNVRYAGEAIPVDLILSEFAKAAGLKVEKIFVLSTGKGNSSQQMGLHGREEIRKCVYYWGKN